MKMLNIKGLPVICLDSGRPIATINGFLVDKESFKVEYVTVGMNEDNDAGYTKKLFRYGDLTGIGDAAVTIQSDSAVRTISSENLFKQVFSDVINPEGLKVISHVGDHVGSVTDYSFDPNTGEILAIVVQEQDGFRAYKTQPYCFASEQCVVINIDQEISAAELNALNDVEINRSVDLDALVDERRRRMEEEARRAETVSMHTRRKVEPVIQHDAIEPIFRPVKRAGNLYIRAGKDGENTAKTEFTQQVQASAPKPQPRPAIKPKAAPNNGADDGMSDTDMIAYMKGFFS